jgi:SAM-dependent methyltransferase
MCDPGFAPPLCADRLPGAPNPWYDDDCPNLQGPPDADTLPVHAPLSALGGRTGCAPKTSGFGETLPYCAYLCFSHPAYGVPVVPWSVWREAQTAETRFAAMAQRAATARAASRRAAAPPSSPPSSPPSPPPPGRDDRAAEHAQGFRGYFAVPGPSLGRVAEFGAGPFTQLKALLAARPDLSVDALTVVEPSASAYAATPGLCAYCSGRLERHGDPSAFHAFSVRVVAEPGEARTLEADPRRQQFDTVVSVNVLEHVQSAYAYLESLFASLRPGGTLVWHERHWADPVEADATLGRSVLHPIRVKREVLEIFLEQFDVLWRSDAPTDAGRRRAAGERGVYVVARRPKGSKK